MLLLFLLTGLVYFALLMALIIGWQRVQSQKRVQLQSGIRVSVIVPFRNEAHHLPLLVQAFRSQTYGHIEFLLVDDHSTDASVPQIQSVVNNDKRFRIITSAGEGKKQAITTGVQHAAGEIILTTDADCVMGKDWIQSMVNCFDHADVMLVMGVVVLDHHHTWWGELQQMEFVSLLGSAAAGVGVGHPFMCNGANLAYRKKAFEKVGGYSGNQHIASGDDEFLMRSIVQQFPDSVRFQADRNAIVTTHAASTVKQFWFQRLRWAAKWKYNAAHVQVLALGVLLIHAVFIAGLFSVAGSDGTLRTTAFMMLIVKLVGELVFLKRVSGFWGLHWNWSAFIALQFAHPFYVVFTGLFSNFMPNTWKGRAIR